MTRMPAGDRRKQLLDVAAELFARKGYSGTTTSELAKAAGVTEPILYHHFDGKRALFTTLLDEVGRNLIENWRTAIADASTPMERLEKLSTSSPILRSRGRNVYRVLIHAMTANAEDNEVRRILRRQLGQLQRFVKRHLADYERSVEKQCFDLDTASWVILHIAIGSALVGPVGVSGHSKANGDGLVVGAINSMLSL